MQVVTRSLATLGLLLGLLALVPLGTTAQQGSAPTVGDIIVDSYDCETGEFAFHVSVTDLPHIPDSNGSLGYSVDAHYDQGPNSELPAIGYNVPAEESPYTGTLSFSPSIPSTNEVFIHEGSDDPVGSITSIDISLGVGYGTGGGPSDTSSITYPVDCGSAVDPTDPPVDPEPTEPDTGSSGETDNDADDGSADDSDDGASDDSASDDTDDGEVSALPSTGAGVTEGQAGTPVLALVLGGLAALVALVALRLRHIA